MLRSMTKLRQFVIFIYTYGFLSCAFAESLPWETPMQKILDSLSGPTAKILGAIAIIIAGFGIAFGEAGSGVRRLFQVVFGLSIVFSSATVVVTLFGLAPS